MDLGLDDLHNYTIYCIKFRQGDVSYPTPLSYAFCCDIISFLLVIMPFISHPPPPLISFPVIGPSTWKQKYTSVLLIAPFRDFPFSNSPFQKFPLLVNSLFPFPVPNPRFPVCYFRDSLLLDLGPACGHQEYFYTKATVTVLPIKIFSRNSVTEHSVRRREKPCERGCMTSL